MLPSGEISDRPSFASIMPPRSHLLLFAVLLCAGSLSCAADDPLDGEHDDFPTGKSDGGIDEGSPEAMAVLALLNDESVDLVELDDDARLNARAARNIIDHRNGDDGQVATADDNPFDSLAELDDVPFVGPTALEALLHYAIAQGYLPESSARAFALFSPLPLDESHNARVAELIDGAQEHVDIAMYSFSSAAISDALKDAVARGVDVRFLFETANKNDKKLEGSALRNSRSGRLEDMGVDVRYVNKIMHHKFLLVDGPRHAPEKAAGARIASGSANWSTGGATIYDENTVFLSGVPEMALELQREFDLMWTHSRDLVVVALPFSQSTLAIDDSLIPDHPDLGLSLTSDNFAISEGSTTFRLRSRQHMAVADAWVDAIERAEDSILVASGHLRLRPVAEALIAKKAAHPGMDIRVYLDQQEYISDLGQRAQIEDREECLDEAETDTQVFNCENKSFLWAKSLADAGIDVRFKTYSYRWHFSYAVQMHNKFMIIDGSELLSGSYNLSVNAEHNTFENVMHFRAPTFSTLIAEFARTFEELWETGRHEGRLVDLRDEIANGDPVPLVFDSMALTWEEVTALKELIRENCPQIGSDDFRQSPQSHRECPR